VQLASQGTEATVTFAFEFDPTKGPAAQSPREVVAALSRLEKPLYEALMWSMMKMTSEQLRGSAGYERLKREAFKEAARVLGAYQSTLKEVYVTKLLVH
jgi:flagellar basal body-associated protein FliL